MHVAVTTFLVSIRTCTCSCQSLISKFSKYLSQCSLRQFYSTAHGLKISNALHVMCNAGKWYENRKDGKRLLKLRPSWSNALVDEYMQMDDYSRFNLADYLRRRCREISTLCKPKGRKMFYNCNHMTTCTQLVEEL